VLRLFEPPLVPKPRDVKFYYEGKFLDYPLTAYSALFQMGIGSGLRAGLSFLKGKLLPRRRRPVDPDQETVEDWAIAHFGEHLYRSFFKPYTEQFWKVPCTELSSRTIPSHTSMSFINTCRLLVQRRLAKLDASLIEREMLPTYYPDSGFQEIAERVAHAARKAGAVIRTGCRAVGIEELATGQTRISFRTEDGAHGDVSGTHVVSTIPLGDLARMLNPAPPPEVLNSATRLDYRALTVLGMVTEKQNILGCSYMYVLNRPYNRISEMNGFSPATSPPGENILMVEIPTRRESPAWTASAEELFDICIGSLAADGFLGPGDVKRLLLARMPHAYPIYRKDYARHLRCVLGHIESRPRLTTLGRTGEFMYMDIDKCMRRAFDVADRYLAQPAAT
jgi:protoporphyrinogen oxidase